MRFQIIIFDGFDELDALGPYEVLQHVRAEGAIVELVTMEPAVEVVGDHGVRIRPSVQLDLTRRPDVVIVPGGGWITRSPKGARAEAEHGAIPAALKSLHESGTKIASVCTGAMLVATAGLLKDRPAITHHGAIPDLRASGAEIIQARVVDDGDVITSGGVTSGLDMALWLVERFYGPQTAQKIEMEMEYERRGTVWRRSG